MSDGSGFLAFFESHHAELSRLAYLMTGDSSAADDLAADALAQLRRNWPRITADGDPAAYARGAVIELIRRRERRFGLFRTGRRRAVPGELGLGGALLRLPRRQRACLVLRYVSGLGEDEVARTLDISASTVRDETARAVRQLTRLLGGPPATTSLGGREAAR